MSREVTFAQTAYELALSEQRELEVSGSAVIREHQRVSLSAPARSAATFQGVFALQNPGMSWPNFKHEHGDCAKDTREYALARGQFERERAAVAAWWKATPARAEMHRRHAKLRADKGAATRRVKRAFCALQKARREAGLGEEGEEEGGDALDALLAEDLEPGAAPARVRIVNRAARYDQDLCVACREFVATFRGDCSCVGRMYCQECVHKIPLGALGTPSCPLCRTEWPEVFPA